MHHLEYGKSYVTLLTEEEILNPFIVLKEVFEESSSPKHLIDELFEIAIVALRADYWRTYTSPLVLYRKYKKIVRLIEAGWLISKIRPDYINQEAASLPIKQIAIDTRGRKVKNTPIDPLSSAHNVLIRSFQQKDKLYAYQGDLFDFLFEGLAPTCVTYDFGFEGYLIDQLHEMEALIGALHFLYNHENGKTLSPSDKELLTVEKERFTARGTLYEYEHAHDMSFLKEYSTKEDLVKTLNLTKGILDETNFWKLHGNPGNMLYHFHDFLFVLEYYWIYLQRLVADGVDLNTKWEYPEKERSEIYQITRKWVKNPWKYLRRQFETKPLADWRALLECCLEDVLGNQRIEYGRTIQYNEVLDFVAVLLIFNEIMQYEPEIY